MKTDIRPPRSAAIHIAGHALAHWHTNSPYHRVFIRSIEEISAGPYLDARNKAHAVIGMVEGGQRHNALFEITQGQIRSIDIDPPKLETGRQIDGQQFKKTLIDQASREIIHDLAGPMAEALFLEIPVIAVVIEGGRDDWEHARILAADVMKTEAEISALLEKQEQATRSLFRMPGAWLAIETLADALLDQASLDWPQSLALIKRHID
ncbi:MAG: hypothetical protein HQL67_00865 [Magnetococcales bacterium]|nr:hypothetical protein [Magnetococcales bacterium]